VIPAAAPAAAPARPHPYRFVVLAVFALVNLTIQILWASYATITGPAARYYGVGDLQIGLLSMVFMAAFVPLSFPVSWAIDRFGFRRMVGLGAVLMSAFGLLRGLAGASYPLVLAGSVGVAAAQPLLLNAWTTVPAKWFPRAERATAVGIVTFGNLVGTGIGFALTPWLVERISIPAAQLAYGAVAAASAALFVALAREAPPIPPEPGEEAARALVLDGLRHALSVRSFRIYLAVSFLGMGVFNGLATWVEPIVRPRGFTPEDAGAVGAILLLGGVLGAVTVPPLSDRLRRRKAFIAAGLALAVPAILGLAFARTMVGLSASAFAFGFALVATSPIGMQYSTEITHPTPEGTSNGLIQLFGQVSVVFVVVMEALRGEGGSFTLPLILSAALLAVSALLALRLVDPPRGSAPRRSAG
jgi:MFS family permease